MALYTRAFALDDIRVRAGGDGRTVEAYAAVFGIPARVRDQDGEYEEEIDAAAFRKALNDLAPQGSRANWRVQVLYNHGMTLHGTPSERASVPIGVPLDIRADGRGLLTVTRYNRTALADDILDAIRDGSITAQSFTGSFLRSTPAVPRGGFRRSRTGSLQRVRRLESSLKEYGPTPFAVYADAAIVGVRAAQLGGYHGIPDPGSPHDHQHSEDVEPLEEAAPPQGAAPEEPHAQAGAHSARSAVAWANTRADIRSRIGGRRAQEEEVRGSARPAR